MDWLDSYIQRVRSRGQQEFADSIQKTAEKFRSEFLENFDYCSDALALLVGNIQSGKTGQMFGIISAAADLDFFIFVVLTTDNVLLQQQTFKRVQREFPDFCVCDESDTVAFEVNDGVKPVIIVLKKNVRTLEKWEKTFLTSHVAQGNPLFILDDEADAASLNTKVNQQDVSAINRHIANIRKDAASSIYLEVTGTPQSIVLQTRDSGFRPSYILAFEPGRTYLGGNDFFPSNRPIPRFISFTDDEADPVWRFTIRHLTVASISNKHGETSCNALAHVSSRISDHESVRNEIIHVLQTLQTDPARLQHEIKSVLIEIEKDTLEKYDLLDIFATSQRLISSVRVTVRNSNTNEEIEGSFDDGINIVVGGNSLGRGITIPRLATVLYTRTSKKPQADTIWQHNRIFGYDRNPNFIKIFLPRHLYKLLCNINDQNNAILDQIRSGITNIKLVCSKDIAPTRSNVVNRSQLELIVGGANYFPDMAVNHTTTDLDQLLSPYGSNPYDRVPLVFALNLLTHIKSLDENFRTDLYCEFFQSILAGDKDATAILLVRRDRDVAQGTGALLSPNDWQISKQFPNDIAITLYRVTGTKGWGGKPLWVPNIRLAAGQSYVAMSK